MSATPNHTDSVDTAASSKLTLQKRAVLKGHTDRVWCCAWSPDGKYLATCGGDKTIRIWTKQSSLSEDQSEQGDQKVSDSKDGGLEDWTCTQVLDGYHSRTVRCVAWSPSGTALASCSFDSTVAVWEMQDDGEFACIASLEGCDHESKWVCWSASGSQLASCGRDKSVWIWQALGGGDWECATVLTGHTQDVKQVKFHPNEEVLFSASYDNSLKVWTLEDGDWYNTCTLSDHTSTVWSLAFSHNVTHLVTVSDDARILVYRDSVHPEVVAVHGAKTVSQATIDAEGSKKSKVSGSARQWKQIADIRNVHSFPIYCVDWSPAPLFASQNDEHDGNASSSKFNVSSDLASQLDAPTQSLGFVATSAGDDTICILRPTINRAPDGVDLTTPSSETAACVDGLEVAVRLEKAHESDVNCVAWNSKQFGTLASCGDDNVAIVWSLVVDKK